MFTEQQQLDNLIRWRDELASGKWTKCEDRLSDGLGRYCAVGVVHQSGIGGVSWADVGNHRKGPSTFGLTSAQGIEIVNRNNDNPGDNFAAVIEYLNEEITRRKAEALVLV